MTLTIQVIKRSAYDLHKSMVLRSAYNFRAYQWLQLNWSGAWGQGREPLAQIRNRCPDAGPCVPEWEGIV